MTRGCLKFDVQNDKQIQQTQQLLHFSLVSYQAYFNILPKAETLATFYRSDYLTREFDQYFLKRCTPTCNSRNYF